MANVVLIQYMYSIYNVIKQSYVMFGYVAKQHDYCLLRKNIEQSDDKVCDLQFVNDGIMNIQFEIRNHILHVESDMYGTIRIPRNSQTKCQTLTKTM